MTDIVERLHQCHLVFKHKDIAEAANEIERLQALLRGTGANRYWEGRWRDEMAENERLRTVLQSLTKDPPSTLAREPDEDWEVIVKMRAIAKAALVTPAVK